MLAMAACSAACAGDVGKDLTQILLRHAGRTAIEGNYIELIDLLLLANLRKVDVGIICNTISDLTLRPMSEYLSSLGVQPPEHIFWQTATPATGPTTTSCAWFVLLTRADYQQTDNLIQMNQWMPVFRCSKETAIAEMHRSLNAHKAKRDGMHKAITASQMKDTYLLCSLLQDVRDENAKSGHHQDLLDRLSKMPAISRGPGSWVAREANADGNCGLWSLLSLVNNDPGMASTSDAETKEEMRRLRDELRAAWIEVSGRKSWHDVYSALIGVNYDDLDEESPDPPDDPESLFEDNLEIGKQYFFCRVG